MIAELGSKALTVSEQMFNRKMDDKLAMAFAEENLAWIKAKKADDSGTATAEQKKILEQPLAEGRPSWIGQFNEDELRLFEKASRKLNS